MGFSEYLDDLASSRASMLGSEVTKLRCENNQLTRVIEEMSHEISLLENKISILSRSGVIYMDSMDVENHRDYLVETQSGCHYVANRKFDVWYDSYSGDEISGVIRVANLQSD